MNCATGLPGMNWGTGAARAMGAAHRILKSCAPLGLLLILAVSSGCAAKRTLTITSDPAGALVRLDDEPVGSTPLEVEFLHYGTRRVTYSMEGFLTRSVLVEVRPPWYARFPLDILSEVVLPVGWRDDHPVHEILSPGSEQMRPPVLRSVLERAEALRRAGPTGPRDMPSREEVKVSGSGAPRASAQP